MGYGLIRSRSRRGSGGRKYTMGATLSLRKKVAVVERLVVSHPVTTVVRAVAILSLSALLYRSFHHYPKALSCCYRLSTRPH